MLIFSPIFKLWGLLENVYKLNVEKKNISIFFTHPLS